MTTILPPMPKIPKETPVLTTRRRLFALAVSASALLAACSAGPPSPDPGTPAPPVATPANGAPSAGARTISKVAISYDVGGRGGGGFNDLAYAGAKRAADELRAELKEITAKPTDTDTDREERLTLLAEAGYNPVIGVGYTYAGPLAKVAPRYPDTWFAIVDDGTVEAPNVVGILFTEEQGSFLVGVAAALTSKTGNVGFVGAVPVPLIQKFEAGFTAGAKAVNPGITVQTAYLSQPPDFAGFNDPALGKEAALGMFDAGADVVFAAAGGSGVGVIGAAKQRGRWAIGVDADEYQTSDPSIRDAVLTSMLKRADVGTYTFVKDVAAGTARGGNDVLDLARDGVGYATSGGFIDGITDQIDAWAARIRSGAITVPTVP
jgi:basic membrane protein A and related proteins